MLEVCVHQAVDQLTLVEIHAESFCEFVSRVFCIPDRPIRVRAVCRFKCLVVRVPRLHQQLRYIVPQFSIHVGSQIFVTLLRHASAQENKTLLLCSYRRSTSPAAKIGPT